MQHYAASSTSIDLPCTAAVDASSHTFSSADTSLLSSHVNENALLPTDLAIPALPPYLMVSMELIETHESNISKVGGCAGLCKA